jgi:murein DD-endopeptidase MepM/ murein hydrolase activator NlpD
VSYQSLYAHLSSVDVPSRPGSAVSTSMMIGRAGKTGASQVELHLAIYRGASLANDSEGTGPYGGVAIIPEPFASCAKNGDACESLAAGDVLAKLPSPPSLP